MGNKSKASRRAERAQLSVTAAKEAAASSSQPAPAQKPAQPTSDWGPSEGMKIGDQTYFYMENKTPPSGELYKPSHMKLYKAGPDGQMEELPYQSCMRTRNGGTFFYMENKKNFGFPSMENPSYGPETGQHVSGAQLRQSFGDKLPKLGDEAPPQKPPTPKALPGFTP